MYKVLIIVNSSSLFISFYSIVIFCLKSEFNLGLIFVFPLVISYFLLRLYYPDSKYFEEDDIGDDGYSI